MASAWHPSCSREQIAAVMAANVAHCSGRNASHFRMTICPILLGFPLIFDNLCTDCGTDPVAHLFAARLRHSAWLTVLLWSRWNSMPRSAPARIVPPDRSLPLPRLLSTLVDNPLKAWPLAMYRDRIFRMRVLGRERIYVMAPDLIRRILADEADNFEKGEIVRRGLGPVLGDGVLTADGSRWRWQRHAVASIFRQERIRSFLPAMLAAAECTRDRWLSYPRGVEIDVAREMMLTTLDYLDYCACNNQGSTLGAVSRHSESATRPKPSSSCLGRPDRCSDAQPGQRFTVAAGERDRPGDQQINE